MSSNFELTENFHDLFLLGKLKFVYGSDGNLYLPDVKYHFSFTKNEVIVKILYGEVCLSILKLENHREDFILSDIPMCINYNEKYMKDLIKKKATEKVTDLIKLIDNLN